MFNCIKYIYNFFFILHTVFLFLLCYSNVFVFLSSFVQRNIYSEIKFDIFLALVTMKFSNLKSPNITFSTSPIWNSFINKCVIIFLYRLMINIRWHICFLSYLCGKDQFNSIQFNSQSHLKHFCL